MKNLILPEPHYARSVTFLTDYDIQEMPPRGPSITGHYLVTKRPTSDNPTGLSRYEVTCDQWGFWTCECKAWQFPRLSPENPEKRAFCKHTLALMSLHYLGSIQTVQTTLSLIGEEAATAAKPE
jgi:hypothetical protein